MASPSTRRSRGIAVLAGLALAITPVAIAHASADRELAPVVGVGTADVIAGRYIVVLDDDTTTRMAATAAETARSAGGIVHHTYGTAIRGFSATLPAGALASLRSNVAVDYIEADQRVTLDATQSPVTWGLDRIDQRNLPLSNSYTYTQTGAGITAYIIDTGIRADHADLSGRVGTGYSAIAGGTNDCNGHGTHVAGTVGSETYGVAKDVALVPVRVLDCNGSGSNSGVIAGVDWVTSNSPGPSVANMSLGGGISSALDTAVRNSVNSGVPYALAAGNSSANACNTSPARVAEGITVGSTTRTDSVSSFSNQGTCLDIFAPGSDITSTWHTSSTATNTISGTSMAAPHVAGVAALYLQAFPGSTSQQVRDGIVNASTSGVLTGVTTGSPNRLLFTQNWGGTPPTTPPPTTPPPTTPPPGGCTLPEPYSGSLTGRNDFDYHPGGTYFQANAGTHMGCLRGPAGTDFDLYLQRWNGFSWANVASGIGSTSTENVTYSGTAAYYRWRVVSYSGAGSYTGGLKRP